MKIWPANTVLLVQPACFRNNEQTATNNKFQSAGLADGVQEAALAEFQALVTMLEKKGIHTIVVPDVVENDTPDSLFPNNWFSTHEDGTMVRYPMYAPNRRHERRREIQEALIARGFEISHVLDLSEEENSGHFLEGTGSLVLDRQNRKAYMAISGRSDPELALRWATELGYELITFHAWHRHEEVDVPVYHTNVMLAIGPTMNIWCEASVRDVAEKEKVREKLIASGRPLLVISEDQMNAFAGNMIELQNQSGQHFLFMSSSAYNSLRPEQLGIIASHIEPVHVPLPVIETNGGGSLRCMVAEVFLPRRIS
ncbi:MAG: amidinotransferase [Flavobacteriales bacterium]|nr:amidinotransferase [Flavobacteriales bacterium]